MKTSSDIASESGRILSLLPEELPEDIMAGMIQSAAGDLGAREFLTFRRVSWSNAWDFEIGYCDPDEPEDKPTWAAECSCGYCGEEWHSGWDQKDRFLMRQGEDGLNYIGIPEREEYAIRVEEGDFVDCPICGAQTVAVAKASLRNGRTYHALMGRMENLEQYTAMIFWLLERKVDKEARSLYRALPWAAVAVGETGKIYRFTHSWNTTHNGRRMPGDAWKEQRGMGEPIRQRYYSWGAINNTQIGGYYVTDVPEQLGTTGEKTGLGDYIAGGGEFPLGYLLRQRKYPYLENLVKAGWVYTIDSAISKELSGNMRAGYLLEEVADLSKPKPKDMLGMSREEVRRFGEQKWDLERVEAWKLCREMGADAFAELTNRYEAYALGEAAMVFGAGVLPKIDAYLQKQNAKKKGLAPRHGLILYRDYRAMLAALGGGETEVELYPPNLQRAHDRLMREKKAAASRETDLLFEAQRVRWAGLEWSDGEICAVLPRNSADLVVEGQKLRHCVGGYASSHVEGKLIVFIRHARRRSRSWFTLNIDTTGREWKEIQLHGYGNEWAEGKKLHIPKKVRDFVDRWEKEILTPEFRKVKAAEKKAERQKPKKKGENAA